MSGWEVPGGGQVSGLPEPPSADGVARRLEKRGVMYVPNFESFGRFILSEQVRKPVAQVSRKIANRAGELSPRRKSGITPPGAALGDRFRVNVEAGTLKVDGAHRVMVVVFNDARSAAPMEFGNDHVGKPGHRMLGRAGAEFGDYKGGKVEA